MQIMPMISRYKDYIILAGFAVGLFSIFDFLPKTFSPLGENVKFVYVAIIGGAGYLYYSHNMGSFGRVKYQSNVAPRNLSNPSWQKQVAGMGGNPRPPNVNVPRHPAQTMRHPGTPDQGIFDQFNRD